MSSVPPLVTRVVLQNFKSVAACDVTLGPLTFLVGPNGSGKSNFVDALRFVSDALNSTLDHAVRDRGGVAEVRRRSGGHPTHFGVRLEFTLPSGGHGIYAFRIAARTRGKFAVQREECRVQDALLGTEESFVVDEGVVRSSTELAPAPSLDRLYLVAASGLDVFRPVFDMLSSMAFYNLNPDVIRDLQAPDSGAALARDGSNLASVLGRIATDDSKAKARIEEYLATIVPGVMGVDRKVLGPRETIEFRQRVAGAPHPWKFSALNMSDGTLRATGVLVALLQPGVCLTAIEEPESALHPAAAGALYDALIEASTSRQVIVTSHSPDLLDSPAIDTDTLLAVESRDNVTEVGRLGDADRAVLSKRLYTAGELLRLGQLSPEQQPRRPDQLALFGR